MNMIRTTHYVDGHELKVGLRLPHRTLDTRFNFKIVAECVAVDPHAWVAEARIGCSALFTTGAHPSLEQAGKAAEVELERRVVALLGDPPKG